MNPWQLKLECAARFRNLAATWFKFGFIVGVKAITSKQKYPF
jgi:hypothetical protein